MNKPLNLVDQYLVELKLHGVRQALSGRLKQAKDEDLGFEDFLNLCLHDESCSRKNARIVRLLRTATLRTHACLESLDFQTPRGLDRKQLQELSESRFIERGQNVLILGPTGVGKSHLATALGRAACRNGKTTLFYRLNTLIEKLLLARAQGTYLNLLKKLGAVDLLILDDFGIKPLLPQQFQDLYDILEERTETKATILTTQLPIENWSEVVDDPVVCEAITDRLVPKAIKITMKGDSYRKIIAKVIDSN